MKNIKNVYNKKFLKNPLFFFNKKNVVFVKTKLNKINNLKKINNVIIKYIYYDEKIK